MATTGLFVFSLLFLCQAFGQIIEPSDPEFASVSCRTHDALEPHPDPCKDDRFVMCSEGTPFAVMRCGPPLMFNSNLGYCTRKPQGYAKPANCQDPQTCEDVNYDGSYIAGRNCTYFIVCVQGEPVIRCPTGSYFKYGIQNCAWPGFGQITNAEIQDCRAKEGPQTPTTTNPCYGYSSGNAPDPYDCKRYYTCSGGQIVAHLDCPLNYRFDTRYGRCESQNNVNCGTRLIV